MGQEPGMGASSGGASRVQSGSDPRLDLLVQGIALTKKYDDAADLMVFPPTSALHANSPPSKTRLHLGLVPDATSLTS